MTNILEIDLGGGIIYKTPPIPEEKNILYHDIKDKKNQYWRTEQDKTRFLDILPDYYLKTKMSEKERIEYINGWREIWVNGLWFFNNGEPTYLNPLMIDHIVFNKFNNRHLNFIESQLHDMYFREWVIKNDKVDGGMFMKPRRLGATVQEITENIRFLISDYYNNIALQSSTLSICKKTLLNPLIDAYLSRPIWMREQYYTNNGGRPRSSLELVSKKVDGESFYSWLGGKVYAYPTTAKAMDGTENIKVTNDEISKIVGNPREIIEVNRKTINNAGKRGKQNLISTSGDSDEVLIAFNEWCKLAAESIYDPITNTSKSGYIKRFTSAIHSQYLPKELLADKYGKINVDRNTEWVENEVNKKGKDTKDYYYEKRKMPLSEDDALISSTVSSIFRKAAITSRLNYLLKLSPSEKQYVRGRLEETNSNGCKKVYFEPDPSGLWAVAIHPFVDVERGIDCTNRFIYSNNIYYPVRNPEFVIGYDPIRYDKGTIRSNHYSRAAIIVHKKYDYHNSPNSIYFSEDTKAALYVGRPERAEDAHYEFCKAMKYWGAIGGFERQVDTVLRFVDEQNMIPMLAKKDGEFGIWTNAKIIDTGVSFLKSRYAVPQKEGQIDYIETYPFEDGLFDLKEFDRLNTTKFDITMAEIILEHTLPLIEQTNVTDKEYNSMSEMIFNIANPKLR